MVREELTVVFEAELEGERGKEFQAEGTASAKALRSEQAGHFGGTTRRLGCLEQREPGKRGRDEVGEVTGGQVPGAGVFGVQYSDLAFLYHTGCHATNSVSHLSPSKLTTMLSTLFPFPFSPPFLCKLS